MIDTIAIQPGCGGREAIRAMQVAPRIGMRWDCGPAPDMTRSAPIGSVEWCEGLLGHHPLPDFYPAWLGHWLRRKTGFVISAGYIHPVRRFCKSGERYKAFPARVFEAGETFPDGLINTSEVVEFVQEWRYYVADGKVVATGWYDGNDEDEPAPALAIGWPPGFCGAVDFVRLSTGEIALVESHHPYACGWYGDDHEAFVRWVVRGWEYMLELKAELYHNE